MTLGQKTEMALQGKANVWLILPANVGISFITEMKEMVSIKHSPPNNVQKVLYSQDGHYHKTNPVKPLA